MKKNYLKPIRIISFWLLMVSNFLFSQSDVDYTHHEVYHSFYTYNPKVSRHYINQLIDKKSDNSKAAGYFYLARFYNENKDYKDQALTILQLDELYKKTGAVKTRAYRDFAMAEYYSMLENRDIFYKTLKQSLKIFKSEPYENFNIAQLYLLKLDYDFKNYPEQVKRNEINDAINYAMASENHLIIVQSLLSLSKYYQFQFRATSNKIFTDSLKIQRLKINDYVGRIPNDELKSIVKLNTDAHYAQFFIDNKQSRELDEVLYDLESQHKLLKLNDDAKALKSYLLNTLASIYNFKNDKNKAIEYYETSLYTLKTSHFKNSNLYSIAKDSLNQLYLKYQKPKENSQKAHDFNSLIGFMNELYTKKTHEKLKYEVELRKISNTKFSSVFSSTTLPLAGIIFLGVFAVILLFKTHFRKIYNFQLTTPKTDNLDFTSFFKKRKTDKELTNYSQNHNVTSSVHPLENHLKKTKTLENINRILADETFSNKLENAVSQPTTITTVHPELFGKLHTITESKLTHLDLKYAAFIYMNMNNSEIANTLKVTTKTVRMTKYRLKQKLGLSRDEDLKSFLQKLPYK